MKFLYGVLYTKGNRFRKAKKMLRGFEQLQAIFMRTWCMNEPIWGGKRTVSSGSILLQFVSRRDFLPDQELKYGIPVQNEIHVTFERP